MQVNRALDRFVPSPRVEVSLPLSVQESLQQDVSEVYYDEPADAAAKKSYYQGLRPDSDRSKFFNQLCDLVQSTHRQHLDYEPRNYDWVHMSPNLRLQPLYGADDEKVKPGAPLRAGLPPVSNKRLKKNKNARELALEQLHREAEELGRALAASPTDAVQTALSVAAFEAKRFFSIEHVVARKWFEMNVTEEAAKVMKGDLHILHPSEKGRNSFRGNLPLRDLPGDGDQRIPDEAFEPLGGKGAAARSTLYFLVRYPYVVGGADQITPADVRQLIKWSQEDPPGLYEKHRNAEIERLQGNRNPFIDHPEWVTKVDFNQGLAQDHHR